MIPLAPGSRILFQGDSITDAGRDRVDPSSLGRGYVLMGAGQLALRRPDLNLVFINRGISGNRSGDLVARWTVDAINLRPDVVSLLIGVNDTWRRFDRNDPTPVEHYIDHVRTLLLRLRAETSARVVVLEPFLLPCGHVTPEWRSDLDPKRSAARALAEEYQADFIPLDDLFRARLAAAPAAYWAGDGVHPTPAGHALIADALVRHLVG